MEVSELTDGGQAAESIAELVARFLRPARRTLELALYDIRLPDPVGSIVADELRAAAERGVSVRLLYNVDSDRPARDPPAPEYPAGAARRTADRGSRGARGSRSDASQVRRTRP